MLRLYSFTFGPFQENTYLLVDENNNVTVIDPGMFFGEEKAQLKAFIEKENLLPTQVLLTHAHLDHVFGLKWINEQYGLIPYLHADEQVILDNARSAGAKYGLDFDDYKGAVRYVTETDTITVGEHSLAILFVPGHSPGSIAFYSAAQDFVIAGDTLFKEGIGRTDLPFGDHATLVAHINDKLFTLPDHTVVYPGHGAYTTIGHEKDANPFLRPTENA
ncbi:MAG: MBL fold metallo-hydrolase [Chitinophagaceae bacterium]